MQFRIVHTTPDALARQLPPELAARLRLLGLTPTEHAFALFAVNDRPIRASVVAGALARLDEPAQAVAIGGRFSVPAAAALQDAGVQMVTLNGASWSEEDWDRIRTSIASPVKGPDIVRKV